MVVLTESIAGKIPNQLSLAPIFRKPIAIDRRRNFASCCQLPSSIRVSLLHKVNTCQNAISSLAENKVIKKDFPYPASLLLNRFSRMYIHSNMNIRANH